MKALKPAVDKARQEWFSSNAPVESDWSIKPLENKDFFITTEKFLPFLDHHNFDYPGRAAQAVLVTLAVVATEWPPPERVIKDILLLVRQMPVSERPTRAPEIVIAYLLGWGRPDLNASGARWESALPEARACLRAVMYVSTDSCLSWLHRYVIGFPEEDTSYFVSQIYNRFTVQNPLLRCLCFLEIAPPGTRVRDVFRLRGNAYRRAVTCLFQQHHLSLWVPHKLPLWLFAQRAVKGFIGKFKPVQFPTGMLCPLIQRYFKNQGRAVLALVKIARYYCNQCKSWTVNTSCQTPACNQRKLFPQHSYLKASRFLILKGKAGGFAPNLVWTCRGPESTLSIDVNRPKKKLVNGPKKKPLCENIYTHAGCDRLKCAEIHDCCPLESCRAPHPMGRARRLSKVFFYNSRHSRPDVAIDSQITDSATAPLEETKPMTSVIDEAALATVEKFAGRPCWIEQTISCLAEDFERWIGLVQTEGHVCWNQLWKALEDAPDRPASPAELQADFERIVKMTLSETFRLKFDLADLDWALVEKYRPPRSDEKEGLE